jgi:hypothetical protein
MHFFVRAMTFFFDLAEIPKLGHDGLFVQAYIDPIIHHPPLSQPPHGFIGPLSNMDFGTGEIVNDNQIENDCKITPQKTWSQNLSAIPYGTILYMLNVLYLIPTSAGLPCPMACAQRRRNRRRIRPVEPRVSPRRRSR